MQLEMIRGEDGIVTVYARASDGRCAAIADFWVRPLKDAFGMDDYAAKDWQQQFASLMVNAHNRIFTKEGDGGFATQAPPSGLRASIRTANTMESDDDRH